MENMTELTGSNCTKVFLPRDYAEGTGVRFSNRFPPGLDGKLDLKDFKHTIDEINRMFDEAEALSGRTYCESCMACLTAYTYYLCFDTYYEKMLKKINRFVQQQNETVYGPRGMILVDPTDRGLRCVEICILENPSPQLTYSQR